jgi:hypothetical protein
MIYDVPNMQSYNDYLQVNDKVECDALKSTAAHYGKIWNSPFLNHGNLYHYLVAPSVGTIDLEYGQLCGVTGSNHHGANSSDCQKKSIIREAT